MLRRDLPTLARTLREDVIAMISRAGSGHPAGSLGMADVFAALYAEVLRHDPQRPGWDERDRLILSNGHICPLLYASLARAGYFPLQQLSTLRTLHSPLQGHPSLLDLPGVEASTGPLGQGFSMAVGMALALHLDGRTSQVYCISSDGEQNEGQVWEAVMLAAKHRLHNLAVIIDRNNIQIDGYTEDVMPLESLRAKYEAFNWHVIEIDGHNFDEILDACSMAKAIFAKPVAIIAHTIPGKGVEFMEWKSEWHGKAPSGSQARLALSNVQRFQAELESL